VLPGKAALGRSFRRLRRRGEIIVRCERTSFIKALPVKSKVRAEGALEPAGALSGADDGFVREEDSRVAGLEGSPG
jgi:hypothetical protein